MKTQILANGVSVIQSTTRSNSEGIVRHSDLGLSTLNDFMNQSEEGYISLNTAESWAPTYNLWTTTLDTTLTNNVSFGQVIIDPNKLVDGNTFPATLQQYADIPKTLLVTTSGSFDVQFTIQNYKTPLVDSPGIPDYILSFSNPQYSPVLNVGFYTTDVYNVSTVGVSQNTAPFIVGNASTLGTNYTVINAQFNDRVEYELGKLQGYDPSLYPARAPYYYGAPLNGNAANCVRGTITMVIDAAKAAGLGDNKFDGTKINASWRGNYRYSCFSSLFKIREERYWDVYRPMTQDIAASVAQYNDRMEYAVNIIPLTNDPESADYGKFNVTIIASSPSSYNSLNLGCRWLVTINKFRNFLVY
jgi:hypothetical protein